MAPKLPVVPCRGYTQASSDPGAAVRAIEVVGKSVELARWLRARVDRLVAVGRPPIAPHRPGFHVDAWQVLTAYLIEERRLIEFLLGPVTNGSARYRNPDDICLDCFRPPDGQSWRFPDGDTRKDLRGRALRINKRLTHFSWTLTEPDTRLDSGIWNTKYVSDVLGGLSSFSDWLETTGSSHLADRLRRSMRAELPEFEPGAGRDALSD